VTTIVNMLMPISSNLR